MGWEDRPYYRDRPGHAGNPLMWVLTGSVPLFTVFGIRVRLHASLLIIMVLVLLFGIGGFGDTVAMRVQAVGVLFSVILLHEFGHCFAARSVGGDANDILMTPLGGLAMAMAPRRPWPTFVTVAGGPLVNVVICLLCGIGLYFTIGLFPLGPWTFGRIYPQVVTAGWLQVSSYLFWIYAVSWFLLMFNLLPVFPLDGGQLLQSVLWKPLGYYKSMIITLNVGLAGSALMAMVGLATLGTIGGGLLLVLIGISCFMNCYQTRNMMRAEGPWGFTDEDTPDYSASLYAAEPKRRQRSKLFGKWAATRARKQLKQAQSEQARIDAILAKVSARGMHSLTWFEKRALRKATERQRLAGLARPRRGL
jgi:Zn-dependent protease